jgi:hypothetical protein
MAAVSDVLRVSPARYLDGHATVESPLGYLTLHVIYPTYTYTYTYTYKLSFSKGNTLIC